MEVSYENEETLEEVLNRAYSAFKSNSDTLVELNKGKNKIVYQFEGYAVAIIPEKNLKGFQEKVQLLKDIHLPRDLFIYPLEEKYFGEGLDKLLFVLYELCSGDVIEVMSKYFNTGNKENIEEEKVEVLKISNAYLSNIFLPKVLNVMKTLHNYKSNKGGIFNFDLKFENLLKCGDKVKIADIDGFGSYGKSFGTVTPSDAISIFGSQGIENITKYQSDPNMIRKKNIYNKRFGILNDLFTIAFQTLFFRMLLHDSKIAIDFLNEMRDKVAGGPNIQNYLAKPYFDSKNLWNNFDFHLTYVKKRLNLFYNVTQQYLQKLLVFRKMKEKIFDQLLEAISLMGIVWYKTESAFAEGYDGFVEALIAVAGEVNENSERRKVRIKRKLFSEFHSNIMHNIIRVKSYEPLKF
jgi:hypothetical protein